MTDLEKITLAYEQALQNARIEIASLQAYVSLLESTLRGINPQEIEMRFTKVWLH